MWMNVASEKQRGSNEWTVEGMNRRTAGTGNGRKCERVGVEAMILVSGSLKRRWV